MNIQDIQKQLSSVEKTLKDINSKLMLELLDVMTENRQLKESIATYEEIAEEQFNREFNREDLL
jgi:hypothetical protein